MPTDSTFPDTLVQALSHAISSGESSLDSAPGLLRQILEEELWRNRVVKLTHERAQFKQFEDFVKTAPVEGLGTTVEMLQQLVAHDEHVAKLLRQTLKGIRPAINDNGGDRTKEHPNNIRLKAKRYGTDPDYILGRLWRDRPDLAKLVSTEKMSANAAAIEAGIYPSKISVNLKDMNSAAATLASRLDADQIDDLISELQKHRG